MAAGKKAEFSPEDEADILNRYNDGKGESIQSLANDFDMSWSGMRSVLVRWGAKYRSKNGVTAADVRRKDKKRVPSAEEIRKAVEKQRRQASTGQRVAMVPAPWSASASDASTMNAQILTHESDTTRLTERRVVLRHVKQLLGLALQELNRLGEQL